jgi:release factor glutamine methyltransferase
MPATLGAILAEARQRLVQAGIADAGLEARLLVEHFTRTERKEAIVSPERPIGDAEALALDAALARRLRGEPVHRIIGEREFYGLPLKLSAGTLEPRPDTETLVELALPAARRLLEQTGSCRILDLGTGTGAIALALLSALPGASALGVDISADALATAAANADMNGYGTRFTTLKSDWTAEVQGKFDLIVSNPPYIPTRDIEMLDPMVRDFDPLRALDGGEDGLRFYRLIAEDGRRLLDPQGVIAVEIGHTQNEDTVSIFQTHGFALINSACDLGGRDRALLFVLAEAP